ncbi:MAG: hypothetical protein HeimC3_19790 [Candidatus Heimdallarchaeota archaeon LC_3]|nr:MAG: hypothetical protein HeimC3_19790 [Candidatus Heimdallarchaeota archaeon LC_3]
MSNYDRSTDLIDREMKKNSNWIWNYWDKSNNKIYYISWAISVFYSLFIVFPTVSTYVNGGMDDLTFGILLFFLFIIGPILFAYSPGFYYLIKK